MDLSTFSNLSSLLKSINLQRYVSNQVSHFIVHFNHITINRNNKNYISQVFLEFVAQIIKFLEELENFEFKKWLNLDYSNRHVHMELWNQPPANKMINKVMIYFNSSGTYIQFFYFYSTSILYVLQIS